MSSIMNVLSPFSNHKRKRSSNDNIEAFSEPDWKRRTTALPIRSPSRPRPASIFPPANPTFTSFHGTLTPIDTSEDESINNDTGFPIQETPSLVDSQTTNSSTTNPPVKANASPPQPDTEMLLSSPTNPRPRPGRARSNDILSSPNRYPPFNMNDRIPTPISAHFDHRLSDLPSAPRHSFPPLRTNLSPMVEQDSWVALPDGLPSPTEDYEVRLGGGIGEEEDEMMSGLQLGGDEEMEGQPVQRQYLHHQQHRTTQCGDATDDTFGVGLGLDGHSSHSSRAPNSQSHLRQTSQARTARLHMGYLAGCEKCSQKVPGHYSHILWS